MSLLSIISFPGIGIDKIEIDPVAFTLFGKDVAWYGIILTLGIVAAFFYVYYRAKKHFLIFDDLVDIAFFTVIPAIICARLYYVLFYELEHPGTYKTFMDVIAIWNGGIAIYGGIIGGALGAFCVLKYKKIRIPQFFDALCPAVMLGQIIGRWGNFVNAEAYGAETTLPWRMGVMEAGRMIYVHPTFLYESLWNLAGFVLINIFYKKRKYDGEVAIAYFTWYGFGRMLIEGLRSDSLYIGSTGIRVSQLIGFMCFAIGLCALIILRIRLKGKAPKEIIYLENAKNYPATVKMFNTDSAAVNESNDKNTKTAKDIKGENEDGSNN